MAFSNLKPLPLWIRLSCETVEPFLLPFSENSLDARSHARVAQHLSGCASCQGELQVLGEMANFFRANPPQTASPSPNLWKNIEAQIRAETPDRVIAHKPRALPVPAARTGFDWPGFSRAFVATGGVMTAAVACVWVVLEHLPLAPSSAPSASPASLNRAGATDEAITIALLPPHGTGTISTVASAVPSRRVEPAPVPRRTTRWAAASRQVLPLIEAQNRSRAPSDRSLPARTTYPAVSLSQTQLFHRGGAALGYLRLGAGEQRLPSRDADLGVVDARGADPVQRVATALDSALSTAAVAAVAASLPSASGSQSTPESLAEPDIHATVEHRETLAQADAVAPDAQPFVAPSRRPTQVAWLAEEGSRTFGSRRSAGDAARDARRQQSLFSYGSR